MICKGKGSIILFINNRLVENILFNSGFDSLLCWEEVEGHCRVSDEADEADKADWAASLSGNRCELVLNSVVLRVRATRAGKS